MFKKSKSPSIKIRVSKSNIKKDHPQEFSDRPLKTKLLHFTQKGLFEQSKDSCISVKKPKTVFNIMSSS